MDKKQRIAELEKEIAERNEELASLKGTKNLVPKVNEMPIDGVMYRDRWLDYDENPYAIATNYNAWKAFITLAKGIVLKRDSKTFNDNNSFYDKHPKKLEELTNEQIDDAVEMLNKMIPIFNYYVRKNNPTIEVKGEIVNPWEKL